MELERAEKICPNHTVAKLEPSMLVCSHAVDRDTERVTDDSSIGFAVTITKSCLHQMKLLLYCLGRATHVYGAVFTHYERRRSEDSVFCKHDRRMESWHTGFQTGWYILCAEIAMLIFDDHLERRMRSEKASKQVCFMSRLTMISLIVLLGTAPALGPMGGRRNLAGCT